MRVPGKVHTEGTLISPGESRRDQLVFPSFSPRTGLFYIPTWDDYSSIFVKRMPEYAEGRRLMAAVVRDHTRAG